MSDLETTTLADGRTLAWAEFGDPDGIPTFFFHGTPGGRLTGATSDERWIRAGIRGICPERPGYGSSDPHEPRTVHSFAQDALQLADVLGLERFVVIGGSGGAPHALALGALSGDRVRAVGALVGASPLNDEEKANQAALNQQVLAVADDPAALRELLGGVRSVVLEAGILALLTDIPEEDLAIFKANADKMEGAIRSALEPGVEGMAGDYLALWVRGWGFDLADVKVPVVWGHGHLDRNVPFSAAQRAMSQLPDCEFLEWPEAGHAPSERRLEEFTTAVLARAT